jgi:predicted flap endonuclease-1-like 5' DNA nuclease
MHLFETPVATTYSGSDATIEILIMLLGAGIIGYLIHYRLCAMRRCCHEESCGRCAKRHSGEPAATKAIIPARPSVPAVAPVARVPEKRDNLEIIEGIGPKVHQVLNDARVFTFAQVAAMTPAALKAILERAGDRFRVTQTESWPIQAALARDGKSQELEEYQEFLIAGREPESK